MRTLILTLLAGAAMAAAAPAFAQSQPVEELTVTGRMMRNGEGPDVMSRVVSYRDLDLTMSSNRDEIRQRINVTAREICNDLGERNRGRVPLGQSCEEVAAKNAWNDVNFRHRPMMAATEYAAPVSTVEGTLVSNGPIPDTRENRARYGAPMSHAGKATAARGN